MIKSQNRLPFAALLAAVALLLLAQSSFAQRGLFRRGRRYGYGPIYTTYYTGYPTPYYAGYPAGYPAGGSGYGGNYVMPTSGTYGSPYLAPTREVPFPAGADVRPAAAVTRDDMAAVLNVRVPAPGAALWVDGSLTTSTGMSRRLVSPPLEPGKEYSYTFRVRWNEGGRERTLTREVDVRAGQTVTVDLTAAATPQPATGEIVPREYTEPTGK